MTKKVEDNATRALRTIKKTDFQDYLGKSKYYCGSALFNKIRKNNLSNSSAYQIDETICESSI